jgi:hypothetical protein
MDAVPPCMADQDEKRWLLAGAARMMDRTGV